MKYLLLLVFFLFSFNVNAQESDNSFVDTVEQLIEVGSLQIDALYIYEDVKAPREGYLLKIEDVAQIKIIMDDFQTDCNRWIDQVKSSCVEDLKACQDSASERLNKCHNERDILRTKIIDLKEDLEEQKNKLLIWTIGGSTVGVALGIITTFILK